MGTSVGLNPQNVYDLSLTMQDQISFNFPFKFMINNTQDAVVSIELWCRHREGEEKGEPKGKMKDIALGKHEFKVSSLVSAKKNMVDMHSVTLSSGAHLSLIKELRSL